MMIYRRVLGSRADKVLDEMEMWFYRSVPRILADMHREAKRYDSALYYLRIADSLAPTGTGCGNGGTERYVSRLLGRRDLYLLANQRDKLLEELVQCALQWDPEDLPAVRAGRRSSSDFPMVSTARCPVARTGLHKA